MTQPDPQTNDEAFRQQVRNVLLYIAPAPEVSAKRIDNGLASLLDLFAKDKEAAVLAARIAGAKQIVDSITKEHDLVKKKNAITLAEQHGYFYAVRDASLELKVMQAQLSSLQTGGKS